MQRRRERRMKSTLQTPQTQSNTMPRQQKFNFLAAHLLNKPHETAKIIVGFNPLVGLMTFLRKDNPEIDAYEGQYVKIFADLEKRVLAWVFAPKEWTKPEELKNYVQIKSYGKAGQATSNITLYIPKTVQQALKMDKKFKRVEVHVYDAKSEEMLDNNRYYYVDITQAYESQKQEA